jgi:hypothetical protein
MKKLYFLIVLFSLSGTLISQTSSLLLSENFTGLNNGSLTNGNGGWVNTGADNRVQVASSTPLFFASVVTGLQYVNTVKSGNADDPYKLFAGNQTIPASANTVVYLSFVVRVANAASTVSAGNSTKAVLALGNNGANNRLSFFIANNGNGSNNLKFGIDKNGQNGASFASGAYSFGTAHLIVIKYVYVAGNNNDLMYMWVDPTSVFNGELPANTAAVTINSGGDNQTVLNSIGFEQSNSGATASFDALRVSYAISANGSTATTNGSAAWTVLAPGSSPLPVRFGSLHAKLVNNAAEISWETYSEENISHYEVQRSSNGQDFSNAGLVLSQNVAEKNSYSFTDNRPLQGKNYYRVRSVDIDGKYLYSVVVIIHTGVNETNNTLQVYPNPVKGSSVNVQFSGMEKGTYTVQLFNMSAAPVYKQQLNYTGGVYSQQLKLPETLKQGVYTMLITNGSVKMVKSITVLN